VSVELSFEISERSGVSVLSLEGEVDVSTAPKLREQLAALGESGRHRVVVDLSKVGFVDSTGLGVVVGGLKRARSAGGDLAVVCSHPHVRKVFDVTGLSQVFGVHDSLGEAVEALRPAP